MRHRTQTIFENRLFIFTKHRNTKIEKGFYTIKLNHWDTRFNNIGTDIRKHFDPAGNRGSKDGVVWKFNNRRDPAQLLTIALMKWS